MANKRYIKGDVHRPDYKGLLKQDFFNQRETFNEGLAGFEAEAQALAERKAQFETEQKQLLSELYVKAMYEVDGKEIDFVDSKADIPVFEDERAFQIADANRVYMEQAPEEYTVAERNNIKSIYDVLKAERDAFNSQFSLMTREEASEQYKDALLSSKIAGDMSGEETLFPVVDTRPNEELVKDAFNQEFEGQ
ncbi:hypothetical protein CN520_23105 [Bacillus cereus]|uniref:hypothetical protein n=2 Tax=Bacillus cereus TaxID=1396 RepID=UPI000BF6D874|nr:hypothetical protein [Bacillus cereus]PET38227.1 hypothetical protein CN520_23105 [Bacillus cereus]PFA12442.1 hypothetical protein CN377_14880 [Bacillus cereus]PGP94689.1 hypothetical protein COA10_28270 [Bacillus cereus]PGS17437.1 hypothetical protein COC51_05070 [Bacillus cereus]PGV31471.1 hypothetical protein COD93_03940 [Bacillus cereus]